MRLNAPIQSLVGHVTTSLPIYNCVIFSNSITFLYSVSSSAKTFLVELLQGHKELMCVCVEVEVHCQFISLFLGP